MQKNVLKKLFIYHKWDLLLVAAFITVSVISWLITGPLKKDGAYVSVRQGQKLIGVYSLKEDAEYEINTFYGANTLVIDNGRAYVKDATCKDHICVKEGKISKKGDMIICLPNELFIEITDGEDGEYDAVVR